MKTVQISIIAFFLILFFSFSLFSQEMNKNIKSKVVIYEKDDGTHPIILGGTFASIQNQDRKPTFISFDSTSSMISKYFLEINNPVCLNYIRSFDQYPIIVFPNDTITVISTDKKIAYHFEGKRANEWNFMAELGNMGYPLMGFNEWDFGSVLYEEYLESAIKKRDKILSLVDNVKDSLKFSPEFTTLLKRDLECAFLKSFIRNHKKYMKPDSAHFRKNVTFVKNYESFFLKDSSRNSWVFSFALMDWSKFLARAQKPYTTNKKSKTYNEMVDSDYGENFEYRFELAKTYQEPIKSEIMYNLLTFRFYTDSWLKNEYEPYAAYFLQSCKDITLTSRVASLSGTYLTKPSREITDILLKNTVLDSKMVALDDKKISWKDFLEKHKNKVIYLDFWASWCGPCRQEFIKSRQNISTINNSNIVFVNISIDDDKTKWIKAIKELKIEGKRENYLIGMNSELSKLFLTTNTVPQYVIIDKNGILRTLEAPKPSSIVCKKILEKLSKE